MNWRLLSGLIIAIFPSNLNASTCSRTIVQGPFVLHKPKLNITIPTKRKLLVNRIEVVNDVELAVLHRSFWKSYCYMGGNIDPNTGCYRGLEQDLPSFREAAEWIARGECQVGSDCTNCWGSDARACLDPPKSRRNWVRGKELSKLENNNHLFFHTCNLSWRCGLHRAKFPTFITRRNGTLVTFTSYSNGSEFDLDGQSFWVMDDVIVKKVRQHELRFSTQQVDCFTNADNQTGCYDQDAGIFFELQDDWYCFERICYVIDKRLRRSAGHRSHWHDIASLKGASLADVTVALCRERLLSEEMRYNFGKMAEEVIELRKTMTQVILSVAKIDDHLIGNVMGHPARSQFLGKEAFLLYPCAEPDQQQSNCVGDLIFKNGRWMKLSDPTQCIDLKKTRSIDLFRAQELWFPRLKDRDLIGTAGNLEGWSYYARERDSLDGAMRWTRNAQEVSSLSDLYSLPKGMLNGILSGFLMSHSFLYIGAAILGWIVYRKLFGNTKGVNVNINQESTMRNRLQERRLIRALAERRPRYIRHNTKLNNAARRRMYMERYSVEVQRDQEIGECREETSDLMEDEWVDQETDVGLQPVPVRTPRIKLISSLRENNSRKASRSQKQ